MPRIAILIISMLIVLPTLAQEEVSVVTYNCPIISTPWLGEILPYMCRIKGSTMVGLWLNSQDVWGFSKYVIFEADTQDGIAWEVYGGGHASDYPPFITQDGVWAIVEMVGNHWELWYSPFHARGWLDNPRRFVIWD